MIPATGATTIRGQGSFSTSPNPSSITSSPQTPLRHRGDSSSSDDAQFGSVSVSKRINNAQAQQLQQQRPPVFLGGTLHQNLSTSSLQNFSRPTITQSKSGDLPQRTASPLTLSASASSGDVRTHTRKHSQTQGYFEPSLTTTSSIQPGAGNVLHNMAGSQAGLSASQIAAQAAMQHQTLHQRQRSQTLPLDNMIHGPRKSSRGGPISPPLLSLTEASGERQSGFGSVSSQGGQIYRNGLLGGSTNPAATAANVVFSRSPQTSPGLPASEFIPPFREPEKQAKPEKTSKVKLFSRPGKITIGKEPKEKALASPNKFTSHAMSSLQRANMSTHSLADSTMSGASSMYSMANSSSATIRAIDSTPIEKEKDKEKKHHFLSRQKHKLSSKDDHHLPLSSAASNSRPVDPNAPSSFYNFNLPPSPGPSSTSFAKSMSGLDLRHGGRALREKKKEEKAAAGSESALRESEMAFQGISEWPVPSGLVSAGGATFLGGSNTTYASSVYGGDAQELAKYGLNNMTADDAWPFLRAKLLIIFEGEDLRLPVEDFNRLVSIHLQRCIQKRSPNIIVDDLRDLLTTGFSSLDQNLRHIPDDRLIPHLVEMWLFTFTSILPYMQAVFLPLDLEFSGHGLMSAETARDFWGALPPSSISALNNQRQASPSNGINVPASQMLEVRRIVLTAYRDTVILPRFEILKTIFSRLSLESINTHIQLPNGMDNLSSSPDSVNRPGTAMSLDPSLASYNSQTTTLLGGTDSTGVRSRAISNVSYVSDPASNGSIGQNILNSNNMPPPPRPFTPSSSHPSQLGVSYGNNDAAASAAAAQREINAAESKHVTETVGRMLQCMSVLSSVGIVATRGVGDEEAQAKMEELCRALKLNWLGRGRTGRNRRGFVGARVKREGTVPMGSLL